MAVGGNTAYREIEHLPDLVSRAVDLADSLGFDNSCTPEQGQLLALLAGGRRDSHIGETGTGCGVGLAWMVSATGPHATFISVEIDAGRATAASQFFADSDRVQILHGDWTNLIEHGPYDLLVLDGGGKGKPPDDFTPLDPTAGWLAVGGMIVLDDFLPSDHPDADSHDQARQHWLNHPCLRSTEIKLTAEAATIVGIRVR